MKEFYGRKISRSISTKNITDLNNSEFFLNQKNIKLKIKEIRPSFSCFNLEIGFGNGDNIIYQAQNNLNDCFLGCDPFLNGSIKIMKKTEKNKFNNLYFSNLDFKSFYEYIKKIKFSKIFILFPDPWPKKKHKKRRLINSEFVKKIHSICKIKSLIYVYTDDEDYQKEILEIFSKEKGFKTSFINIDTDFPERFNISTTKYFRRAQNSQRKSFMTIFKYKNLKN
tara:strand:+ start:55 stop:726 length:672 start_codon:yes stop_codon:yes gene_type:complete